MMYLCLDNCLGKFHILMLPNELPNELLMLILKKLHNTHIFKTIFYGNSRSDILFDLGAELRSEIKLNVLRPKRQSCTC